MLDIDDQNGYPARKITRAVDFRERGGNGHGADVVPADRARDSGADYCKFSPGSTRPYDPVRIQNELLRCTLVEVTVPARRVLQGQDLDIYRLRDTHLVMQDSHHKVPIVAEHRTLPVSETVGLGQPRPIRRPSTPFRAFESFAAGSSVT